MNYIDSIQSQFFHIILIHDLFHRFFTRFIKRCILSILYFNYAARLFLGYFDQDIAVSVSGFRV